MRRSFILLGCLLGLALAATPQAVGQEKVVEMKDDNTFAPASLTVDAGDTIVFRNVGALPHTATASDKSFDTGNVNGGQSKSVKVTKSGTIDYVCTYHQAQGMVAKLVVQGEAVGGGVTPSPPGGAMPSPSPAQEGEGGGNGEGEEEAAGPELTPAEKYFPPVAGALSVVLVLGLAAGYYKTFVAKAGKE